RSSDLMPRASHWVTPSAATMVTGSVSHAGTPARVPTWSITAAARMLSATSSPILSLMEPTGSSGRSGRTSDTSALQRVADAVDGSDPLRTDLGAQRLDVAVEGARAACVRPAPDPRHQLLARVDRSRPGRQGSEQVELQRRQVHVGSLDLHSPGAALHRELSHRQDLLRGVGQLAGAVHPPQQGPDPRHDLAGAER